MKKIPFFASPPDTREGRDVFDQTLDRFNALKSFLWESKRLGDEALICSKLSEKFGVDSFMVHDVLDVMRGTVEPQVDPKMPRVFWSLGRQEPRHGKPWANLELDELDACSLGLRWDGSFEDDEDPPKWVYCKLTVDSPNLGNSLFAAARIDVWLTVLGEQIEGVLVL